MVPIPTRGRQFTTFFTVAWSGKLNMTPTVSTRVEIQHDFTHFRLSQLTQGNPKPRCSTDQTSFLQVAEDDYFFNFQNFYSFYISLTGIPTGVGTVAHLTRSTFIFLYE